MKLLLNTDNFTFTVTKAPEPPRKDYGKDQQKMDRDTGRPQWVVEVLAMDAERGEVILVAVAGDEGAVGDDELKPDRFPGTRFPAEDHVPLGQGDLDPAAEFVSTQVHGFPDRQRGDRDAVSRHRCSPPRLAYAMRQLSLSRRDIYAGQRWWSGAGSNRRPSAFQADARTN
jgi:hypothetical protein